MVVRAGLFLLTSLAAAYSFTVSESSVDKNPIFSSLLPRRTNGNRELSIGLNEIEGKNNSGHGKSQNSSTIEGDQHKTGENKKTVVRCDKDEVRSLSQKRVKRYSVQGSKWRVKHLSYKISSYPRSLPQETADREIERAFKVWSDVTPFTFTKHSDGPVHIEIKFVTGEHGDHQAFDEYTEEIAHAFYPSFGGDIHFDDAEDWTYRTEKGRNLFQVMTHELGHSLGLEHSEDESAVMYFAYKGYNPDYRLNQDDLNAIQTMYGNRVDGDGFFETGDSLVAELCNDASIDTIFYSVKREIFVFKGNYYWKMSRKGLIISGPSRISSTWPGLPGHIDAAFTSEVNGKTYFFKKKQFWRYNGYNMDNYYPRLIGDGFHGIPDDIDAVMFSSKARALFFFKGSKFWKFDPRSWPPVLRNFPRTISQVFKGAPHHIDAVISTSKAIYFFNGKHYYEFQLSSYSVESSEPNYKWFGCEPQNFEGNPRPPRD